MSPITSIFLDFRLPNATTWFYLSLCLAVVLFFKFSRLLSIRNWDVITLFLLVPGMLLVRSGPTYRWLGYVWLLCGSVYFFIRCLVDLALVRRPALNPNLNLGGLAWLGCTMFACLVSVAYRPQDGASETGGKTSAAVVGAVKGVEKAAVEVQGIERRWVEPSLALLCHLAAIAALIMIGWQIFQDIHSGMAAATFYLLLPYTALHVGQLHHIWPVALLIWAVALYRRPILSGFLLGLGAGTMYFPVLLFPTWLSFYWRRGAGRFTGAFVVAAALSLAIIGISLWVQGDLGHSLQSTGDWQPWNGKPTTEGFWMWQDGRGIHWAYRIPVFIAYLAFVATTFFWPNPKNLAHVLALSAAVLIGIQFWYSDRGGVYVLWYLPLLLLLTFRPNLADRQPPPIQTDTDWLLRWCRALGRFIARLHAKPEPLTRVH